uniref:Plastocyanin-like domain-containing protein n=1 Tax=Naja naja TaxID=35670 RepID=A0A8C6XRE3_NAJNA
NIRKLKEQEKAGKLYILYQFFFFRSGLLGPIIQAEVYDKVVVTFKNMASHPFNIHAKGVSYWKASEGAGYEDLTSQLEKEDDAVEPGHTHVYVWEILEDQGPTGSDTHCLTYAYSSHVDSIKDINSGLIGPLLVCKPGALMSIKSGGKIQEFVLLFSVFDEGKRRMRGKERKEYAYAHPVLVFLFLLLSISPRALFFSLPADLRLCEKRPVYWYVISLGSRPEVHSILFEGHSFLKKLRLAEPSSSEDYYDEYGEEDMESMVIDLEELTPRIAGRSRAKRLPLIWTHYIAAEEGDWDYAPVNTYSKSLENGPQRIGSKYKKAMFVEYEDGTFSKQKAPKADHLGLLGPVLQGEVGDEFIVISPSLIFYTYQNMKVVPIRPKQVFTYRWKIMPGDGPTRSDPSCLTRYYYSSIKPAKDLASGLIGPLLICFKETMDQRGNQVWAEFHVKVSRTSLDINPPAEGNFSRPMKEKSDYDDYSNTEESKEDFDIYEDEQDPRMFTGKIRPYYIAAVEVTWDYGGSIPSPYLRDNWRKLSRSYKKVVFQEYFDSSFTRQMVRGELDEHLGILGPFIRGQVEDTIVVTFKNMASRPYSFHSNLLPYEGSQDDGEYQRPEAVQPNQVRQYSFKVLPEMAPSANEFNCKAWAYFSSVNLEKDLHSGLIGPLIICQAGVLRTTHDRQLTIQEFSLLFTIFDETKSWYFAENFERSCRSPCRIQMDDPCFPFAGKLHGMTNTLPGLVMGLHQRVRWYLLNAGGVEDIHTVHFHGQVFNIRMAEEYRLAIYNLFPGEAQYEWLNLLPVRAGI